MKLRGSIDGKPFVVDMELLAAENALSMLEKQFDRLEASKSHAKRIEEANRRSDVLRKMIKERGEEPCA